jgi:hypothetical protein
MFRKLPTVLAIAILLGAVSAAPALAQTRSHQGDHQSIGERPAVPFTRDYATQPDQGDRQSIDETTAVPFTQDYATQPDQGDRQSIGETPAVPFTQDPESPR